MLIDAEEALFPARCFTVLAAPQSRQAADLPEP